MRTAVILPSSGGASKPVTARRTKPERSTASRSALSLVSQFGYISDIIPKSYVNICEIAMFIRFFTSSSVYLLLFSVRSFAQDFPPPEVNYPLPASCQPVTSYITERGDPVHIHGDIREGIANRPVPLPCTDERKHPRRLIHLGIVPHRCMKSWPVIR